MSDTFTTRGLGVLGSVAASAGLILLVSGCENAVFGTMAPAAVETARGSEPTALGEENANSPDASVGGEDPTGNGGAGSETLSSCVGVTASCRSPIRTADVLQGRLLPEVQTLVTETVSAQRIFDRFDTACGRCHAPPELPDESNGNWVVQGVSGLLSDPAIWDEAIKRIESLDPELAMPPTRDPAKPLPQTQRELLDTLREWTAKGRSDGGFTREVTVTAETPYRYTDEVRLRMTNLGDCIPEPELVGCRESEITRLDEKFASMESFADLPKRLQETDMFTLDSTLLAEQRVISYAPTYTLFSDNAKKMRYVRVPAGQVISYNPETRDYDIPENTRFYKTFLRHVVGSDGQSSYRKVETRIILVRKDGVENGQTVPRAIFGTYLWSLDEARAELAELPYNDQTPFRDVALRHVLDEQRAQQGVLVDAGSVSTFNPDTFDGIVGAFEHDEQLRRDAPLDFLDETQLLTRGYAVPGRDRCIQCHMGSSSHSFILGFNQYQADRRPAQHGGVFDAPAGADELSQLQRLIDYGVVVDATRPRPEDSVRHKLEESQGERSARNGFELKAQGYMLGNCAFCHNPSGFPSVENPVLKDVLDFFPRGAVGGIFQFPLDRYSPRTSRTPAFNKRFPYITPSLFERDRLGNDENSVIGVPPKSFAIAGQPYFVAAPWRALLYRNVQTPFTYAHDEAIHPHMPLNVPGYDFRAAQIMGDWMLSIPARLADGAENNPGEGQIDQPWIEVKPGDTSYPYDAYSALALLRREVFRSERIVSKAEFDVECNDIAAKHGAPALLEHCNVNGGQIVAGYLGGAAFRPDTSDVVAPEMRGAAPRDLPFDRPFVILPGAGPPGADAVSGAAEITQNPADLGPLLAGAGRWEDGIPDRPHWVLRDLTSIPGKWSPRGSRWEAALANEEEFVPRPKDLSHLQRQERERAQHEQEVRRQNATRVFHLQKDFVVSDELRRFALGEPPFGEYPYGLWQPTPTGQNAAGCEEAVSRAPAVADFEADPPRWFAESGLNVQDPEDRARLVYAQPAGEIMFSLICINCHGKAANGESLLANTILELTGGRTRVANLRDGIFGEDGASRSEVFHDENVAVRYLLWMGMGGTEATIPSVVLNRVGATRPLGVDRIENPNAQATANMLDNAVGFCKDSVGVRRISGSPIETTLGFDHKELGPGFPEYDGSRELSAESALVASNGDASLWLELCGMNNPGPIRAIKFQNIGPIESYPRFWVDSAYWRDIDGHSQVPRDARFGDQRGRIQVGLEPDNLLPWCMLQPSTPEEEAELLMEWHGRVGRAEEPPWCPDSLFIGAAAGLPVLEVAPLDTPDERRDRWAARGAMNVGASVFTYLDALSKGKITAKPAFDACVLPAPTRR